MRFPVLSRVAVASRLTNEYGEPLTLTPMLRELLGKIDDPAYLEYLLVLIRQSGKTETLKALAATELLCVPGSYTMLTSATLTQQQQIFHRRVRRPLERLLNDLGLDGVARFSRTGVEVPDLGSELRLVAPNDAAAGRTPTKLLIDEARDVPDAAYATVAPSIIGAGGKVVIAGSPGRPAGFFYELVTNPDARTWIYRSTENDNPHASRSALDFLRRRLGLVAPSAAARDLDGQFADDGEALFPTALLQAARDENLGEVGSSSLPAYAFLDLSRRHDLTTLAVVIVGPARRPEASNHVELGSLTIWNPKDAPGGETPFDEVRAAIGTLPRHFPGLVRLLVDEGAEGGAVLPFARQHPALSLLVEGFQATPSSNMDLWGALSARLHAQTISLPPNARLFAELRGLRRESYAFGTRWRVVDASRKLHRDVSLAVAGAVYAAQAETDGDDPTFCVLFANGDSGTSERETEVRRLADQIAAERTDQGAREAAAEPGEVENQMTGSGLVSRVRRVVEAGARAWRGGESAEPGVSRHDAETLAEARRQLAAREDAERERHEDELRRRDADRLERAVRTNAGWFPQDGL